MGRRYYSEVVFSVNVRAPDARTTQVSFRATTPEDKHVAPLSIYRDGDTVHLERGGKVVDVPYACVAYAVPVPEAAEDTVTAPSKGRR